MTYAIVVQEKQYPLQVGKNVVGRSSAPVDGVSFINLASPLAAISRMQAFLDVAANGDAWISDCNSTNGTFLSIRPGPGIRLDPHRYYQLTPGCRIVFGDVECTFEALDGTPHTPLQPSTATSYMPTRKTEPLATHEASGVPNTSATSNLYGDAAQMKTPVKENLQRNSNGRTYRGDVPYLDESGSPSQEHSNTVVVPTPAQADKNSAVSPDASAEKKGAKRRSLVASPSPVPTKKPKKETTPVAAKTSSPSPKSANSNNNNNNNKSSSKAASPPVVCLTGMDSDERAAITKRVRQLKGRVMDDITKANLLVVAVPPVRTPKFIIAVARGIPIVSAKYICNDSVELEDARRHIVGLKTDQHTYTAAALEKVIYRQDNRPLLQGVRFNISSLSNKAKGVATEIIVGAGGEVVRTKKTDALDVSDDQLDSLYDSILRGKVPQSL